MFISPKKALCALALSALATSQASEQEQKPSLMATWSKGAFDLSVGMATGAATTLVGSEIMKHCYAARPALALPALIPAIAGGAATGKGVMVVLDKGGEIFGVTHYDNEKHYCDQEPRYGLRSIGFVVGAYVTGVYVNPRFGKFMDDVLTGKNPFPSQS